MVFTKESVDMSQIDDLAARLFNGNGVIKLDKNDLYFVLAGENCVMFSGLQEDESNREFLKAFLERINDTPKNKDYNRMLINVGCSVEAPLMMQDMEVIRNFFEHVPCKEADVLWGVQHNAQGVGMTAVAVCSNNKKQEEK